MPKNKENLFFKKLRFIFLAGIFLFLTAAFPSLAFADATLSLNPSAGSYYVGNNFSVSINVDTGGAPINAAQINLTFDQSKLSISSIDVSQSIFTIWTQYPSFSNTNGTINFSGGIPSPGFTGVGSIVNINFKALILGSAAVSFVSGGQVLANDGLGTNILGNTFDGAYNISPAVLNVSCFSTPSSAVINQYVTFSASVSGGNGIYDYLWSGECAGTSSACSNSYATTGTKTATITVTSGTQTISNNCSVDIGLPSLNLSCSASPSYVNTGDTVTFSASVSGGNGIYDYLWSGECAGTSSTCSNSYATTGTKTATITVTSGVKTASRSCSVNVGATCPAPPTCPDPEICSPTECPPQVQCPTQIPLTPTIIIQQVPAPVQKVAEQTKKIIETPEGSAVTKTISTTGSVVATVATAGSLFSFSFFDIFLLIVRLFSLLLTALGFRKKVLSWGVVYDSVTKQPLDPAYVTLKNKKGENVASAITDLDGRFGFLAEPGVYNIQARKTNYIFPSQKLSGKTGDELYDNLYFGEDIIIRTSGEIIVKNIPLDPVKFDWNEFTKKSKHLMKFYSRWDALIRKIYGLIFVIGFIVAVVSYVFAPYPYNTAILVLYLVLLLFRVFGLKSKTYGYITEKATGIPLSFAILRIVRHGFEGKITPKSITTDRYGKYYCLVVPGKYYVQIEKKNDDGSYSLAYSSQIIDVSKKGIINERFRV